MRLYTAFLTLALSAMLFQPGLAASPEDPTGVVEKTDWPAFLRASGPDLPGMPFGWHEQPFTGNGREGMLAIADRDLGALSVRLGRSDVVDHRITGDTSIFSPCFDSGRLPIGRLLITAVGKPDPRRKVPRGGIDLWNAEGFGTYEDDSTTYNWRIWTPMGAAVNVIEIETLRGKTPAVRFLPEPAITERTKAKPGNYTPHPPAVASTEGDVYLSTQSFPAGGGYTVAYRSATVGTKLTIVSAIGYDRAGAGHRAEALASLNAASDLEVLRKKHRAFWASWWPRSSLSVPDAKAQSFYYLQLYKLASATRPDGPMMDLMGPWYGGGPWPAIWWNLNVQLAYQPCASANRVEMLDSLIAMIEQNADAMGKHVPAQWGGPAAMAMGRVSSYDGNSKIETVPEAGNLTWALAVAWDGYRLTGNRKRAERLLPLMSRAAAFHVARAKAGADGKLHLPAAISPESGAGSDCVYELGPMRWMLRTLVAAEKDLGWKHPDQPLWRETLAKLTPLPSDENGYLKAAGQKVSLGHRHWSHLIHIYPLRDFDPDDPAEYTLVRKSVAHWTSSRSEWRGYSGLGASSMWSLLGEAEAAAKYDIPVGGANSLYREAGPCIETPLQAAATLQERLITWDRRGLRLFAGTPAAWKNAAFHQLRAPLGLTVSAARKDGTTQWVRMEAAVAQTVRIEPRFGAAPRIRASKTIPIEKRDNGWYELTLDAGQSVLLVAPDFTGPAEIAVSLPTSER